MPDYVIKQPYVGKDVDAVLDFVANNHLLDGLTPDSISGDISAQIANQKAVCDIDKDALYERLDEDEANISGCMAMSDENALNLSSHIEDDSKRWAALSTQVQQNTLPISKILSGDVDVVADTTRTVNLASTSPFTVPASDTLGGQIAGSAYTYLLFGTGHIEVNDVSVFDIRGLTVSVDKSSYAGDVQQGDVITNGGMTTFTYTPYKARI